MAFDSYGDFNKRTDVPLYVTYQAEQVTAATGQYGRGGYYQNQNWWKLSRRARKTYSYVGLTKEAAKRCAEEKMKLYTRPFSYWGQSAYHGGSWCIRTRESYGNNLKSWYLGDKYFAPVADISISRNGVVYNVQITVDEVIVIYRLLAPLSVPLNTSTLEKYFREPGATGLTTESWGYDE